MEIFKHRISNRVVFIIDAILLLIVQLSQGAALNFIYHKLYPEYLSLIKFFVLDLICFTTFIVTFVQAYRYFTRKTEEKREQKSVITKRRSFMHSSFMPFFHISWVMYITVLVAKLIFIFGGFQEYKIIDPEILQVCLACSSFVFMLLVEAHNWHKKTSESFSYVFGLGKKTGIEIFDSVDMLEIIIKKDYISTLLECCIFSLATLNFVIPTICLFELRKTKFGENVSAETTFQYKIMHSIALLFLIDIPFFAVRFHSWLAFKDLSMFMMKNLFNIIVAIRALYLDFVTFKNITHKPSKKEEIPLNQTEQTQTDSVKTNDL